MTRVNWNQKIDFCNLVLLLIGNNIFVYWKTSALVKNSKIHKFCTVCSSTCKSNLQGLKLEIVTLLICTMNNSKLINVFKYEGRSICNENSPVYPKVL